MNELELIQAENTAQLQRAKLDEFYNSLEKSDAEFLQVKEYRLAQIVGHAKTEMGKELKDAQERLANHDKTKGIFVKWIELLDIGQATVYNLINRYDYVLQNLENRNVIESLPLSLSYEVAKPNAPKELVAKVLNGDITTHKEFVEQKKELDGLTRKNETLQQDLFSVKEPNQEYESKITDLEYELQQIKHQLEIEKKKPAIEVEVIKYEPPAELLQQKQMLESELADMKNKAKLRANKLHEKDELIKQIREEKFKYYSQLTDMQSERETLERKIKEMQNTVEELSMYKNKFYDIKKAQKTLVQYETDLANMRIKIEDTTKFVSMTSNIKEFINSNLVPMLTTIHLPKENEMIKQDFQLICKTLEDWIFAIKQTFNIESN